jgi:hypothetical protein
MTTLTTKRAKKETTRLKGKAMPSWVMEAKSHPGTDQPQLAKGAHEPLSDWDHAS